MSGSAVVFNIYNRDSVTGLLNSVSLNNPSTSFAGIPCGIGAVVSASFTVTYGYSGDVVSAPVANWFITSISVDFVLQSVTSLFPVWNTLTTITPILVPQTFSVNFVQVKRVSS